MKNTPFNSRTIAFSTIVINSVICGYLVFRSVHLNDNVSKIPDLCKTIFGNSCDTVLSVPASWHFGYPLVGIGLSYFGLLGLLLSFNKLAIDRFVLIVSAFGVGISIYLSNVLFETNSFCPLCLIIHFVNLLAFIALFISTNSKTSFNEQKQKVFWRPFILRAFLILLIIVAGTITESYALRASLDKSVTVNYKELTKKYQSETIYNIPRNEASPIIGSLTAPIQLIVFSSFQCSACKTFAPTLERIHKKYGDIVAITFKNFPLSKTCNPKMNEDMQPQACDAAFAAKAAQLQNKFWNYHDELFKSTLEMDEKSLYMMAKNIGLNMEKFEADKKSEVIKANISADVNLGYQLEIDRTPTVFINGKRVSDTQEAVLDFLIQIELNKG